MVSELKIDNRLRIIKNIIKTFKYFLKSILYNIFINVVGCIVFMKIRGVYTSIIYRLFIARLGNIMYIGVILTIFVSMKLIYYGNIITNMNRNFPNDIKELYQLTFIRLFSVIASVLIYLCTLSLAFTIVLPFYYIFAPLYAAVGDLNDLDREKNQPRILLGGQGFSKSKDLISGNLIMFAILTVLMAIIVFFLQYFIIDFLLSENLVNTSKLLMIRLIITDIFIIYISLMFAKLNNIQIKAKEEAERIAMEQQAKMSEKFYSPNAY